MKRERGAVQAFLLAIAGAWAVERCLQTAFQLPLPSQRELLLFWAVQSLVILGLLHFRRGGWLVAALDLAFLSWLAWDGRLVQSFLSLAREAAEIYDTAYEWGVPELLQERTEDIGGGFLLLGIPVVQSVCIDVFRRRPGGTAAACLVLPLCTCLVVTDTVPEAVPLAVLLFCLVLLLLTDSVRAESADQGRQLTLMAAVPILAALGLLFWLVPKQTYQNPAQHLREQVIAYIRQIPEKLQSADLSLTGLTRPQQRVNLSNLASQPRLGLPVAEAAAEHEGTVYLRVKDYDIYTGSDWISTEDRSENISGTGENQGAVVVRELSSLGNMLVPSFPAGDTVLQNGAVFAPEGEKVYRVERMSGAIGPRPGENWLALPRQTALRAGEILNSIPGNWQGTQEIAAAIGEYVRSCAVYDRFPGAMPEEETDFAIWFLKDGDRGFCVHFATAAVVLLRSAGIPARYVTGYRMTGIPGESVHITSNEAHAWVEYYDYGTWTWSILEATPADGSLEPAAEPEETTQASQPQTAPSTVPTETEQIPQSTLPVSAPEQPRQLPARYFLLPLMVLLPVLLAETQRNLRLRCRARKQKQGITNRRAIARWRELQLLHRLTREPIPELLTELAEKAVFSQHALTREELARFAADASHCRRLLRKAPWWKVLWYRYWYAVI